MRKYVLIFLCLTTFSFFMESCSKNEKGFISPNIVYNVPEYIVSRGIVSSSTALTLDGSTYPISVKALHYKDANGNIVDSIFQKTYPVTVWTEAYDATSDTTFASITAKRVVKELTPFEVNESNGSVTANSASLYLPIGDFYLDVQVSNSQGSQVLTNALHIQIVDSKPIQTTPEIGSYSIGLLNAGTSTAASHGGLFTGNNNPFVVENIIRKADTPNLFVLKIVDKDGRVFSGEKGEFVKRPASGLNPTPPYLQNLQYYAPDTFNQPDSGTLNLLYPLTPFPIASLGNGYNMYYIIPAKYITIDSTSTWTSNASALQYQGSSDSKFLGYFKEGLYDYSLRIPLRIMVPGSYQITLKLLNTKHK